MSAQLKVDGKVFVSSFAGDGVDVSAMRSAAGVDLFCMSIRPSRSVLGVLLSEFLAFQMTTSWVEKTRTKFLIEA